MQLVGLLPSGCLSLCRPIVDIIIGSVVDYAAFQQLTPLWLPRFCVSHVDINMRFVVTPPLTVYSSLAASITVSAYCNLVDINMGFVVTTQLLSTAYSSLAASITGLAY